MLEVIIDGPGGFARRPLNGNSRCMALHGIAWQGRAGHTANDNPAQESLLEINTPH